jgi:hypothetical protein
MSAKDMEKQLSKQRRQVGPSDRQGYKKVGGNQNFLNLGDVGDLEGYSPRGERLGAKEEEEWMTAAENGELEIFTCLAISNGCTWSRETRRLFNSICLVLVLQIGIPAMLLSNNIERFNGKPSNDGHAFRISGTILYLYSIRHMYHNAFDECRSMFLNLAFKRDLPIGYVWPAIAGELVNSFVGFGLTAALFVIFCNTTKVEGLVLNAVGVNFLGSIDTEFASPEFIKVGVDTFQELMRQYPDPGEHGLSKTEKFLHFLLQSIQVGGILVIGSVFAAVLLLSHQPMLCQSSFSEALSKVYLCGL